MCEALSTVPGTQQVLNNVAHGIILATINTIALSKIIYPILNTSLKYVILCPRVEVRWKMENQIFLCVLLQYINSLSLSIPQVNFQQSSMTLLTVMSTEKDSLSMYMLIVIMFHLLAHGCIDCKQDSLPASSKLL